MTQTLVGDGVADDTDVLQNMIDTGNVELPAGTFRITRDLHITASQPWTRGLRIRGAGMLASTILGDYNGDVALGAILRFDTSAISRYTLGSELADFSIQKVPGRTGLNGLQLTAAWFVDAKRLMIKAMSGSGLIATIRPDIHPTISDYYQSFAVNLEALYIRECAGWGIKFAAGQSPGLYRLAHSMIWGNAGGGVMSTTGQCEIVSNVIAENGNTAGGGGGLLFDTAEGPSMVADVRQNELDCNWNYNLWLKRTRGHRVTQNRFLHCTMAARDDSQVRVSGGPYMRPPVGAKFGSANCEVTRGLFEQNLHRSVTGPNSTTAPVVHYQHNGGELRLNRIWYNDIDNPDGLLQNSSGSVKFEGFSDTDTSIIDLSSENIPPTGPIYTVIASSNLVVGQNVYSVDTMMELVPVQGPMTLYVFTAPESRTYRFEASVQLGNGSIPIRMVFADPGTSQVLVSKANANSILADLAVQAGDRIVLWVKASQGTTATSGSFKVSRT